MNADDNFRELLADCPFDGSYRETHRDEVRERALRAFDEAAAAAAEPATLRLGDLPRRTFTRRRVAGMALALAAAAGVCVAMAAWFGRLESSSSPDQMASQLPAGQSEAQRLADAKLVAALNQLSDFDEERSASAFDRGVQTCLSEYYSQIALRETP